MKPDTAKRARGIPLKLRRRTARQARSKATVEAVLTAGARILAAKGWAGFTTNAVAAKAGVSIGSLYEYFPDKGAICAAILERHIAQAEQLAAARLEQATAHTAPSRIARLLVRGFVDLHAEDPRLHRVLSSEVPVPAHLRRRIEALTERLAGGVAIALAGHVPEARIAARLLVDAADSLTHRWIVDAAGKPLDAAVMVRELERLFEAYLNSVAVGPRG
jgi:AcrR family transcriptional regulator